MNSPLLRKVASLIFLYLASEPVAFAADLELSIHFSKRTYKVGDGMEFQIEFRNTSDVPIKVIPEIDFFSSDLLSIRKTGGRAKVEYLRPDYERVMDLSALSEYVVLLNPKDSLTRNYTVKVSSSLPKDYKDKSIGLFLVFPDSAIKLTGFGKYEARADYDSNDNMPGDPSIKLWRGKVLSRPVMLDFKGE